MSYLKKLTEPEIDRLKSSRSSPSPREIMKFLHVTDCDLALENWQESWTFCPVCGATYKEEGHMVHIDHKESPN